MKLVEDLKEPPQIGSFYLVKCATVKLPWRTDIIEVPIMGTTHIDKNLNVDYEHYHVDGRFFKKELFTIFLATSSYAAPGSFKVINTKHIICVSYKKKRCTHYLENAKSTLFKEDFVFKNFAKVMKKKSLKMVNMICPHKGYDLSSEHITDGTVICPMHCLKFNVETGEQIV